MDPKHCISELLVAGNVDLDLPGSSRDQVLTELVGRVPELARRPEDRQRLLLALLERENLHSTGLGDGIALPHPRTTLGGLVTRPLIVLGRHPQGVGFGAIDAKPVRLFFLLLTTSVTEHLQILARISRLLRDPRLRETLLLADLPAKALDAIRRAESAG